MSIFKITGSTSVVISTATVTGSAVIAKAVTVSQPSIGLVTVTGSLPISKIALVPQGVIDSLSYSPDPRNSRELRSFQTIDDLVRVLLAKQRSDTVSASESIFVILGRILENQVSVNDDVILFLRTVIGSINLVDVAEVLDALALLLDKQSQDQLETADTNILNVVKGLNDQNDLLDALALAVEQLQTTSIDVVDAVSLGPELVKSSDLMSADTLTQYFDSVRSSLVPTLDAVTKDVLLTTTPDSHLALDLVELGVYLQQNSLALTDDVLSTISLYERVLEDLVTAQELLVETTDGFQFQTQLRRFDSQAVLDEFTRIFLADRKFEHEVTTTDANQLLVDLGLLDPVLAQADQPTLFMDMQKQHAAAVLDTLALLLLFQATPDDASVTDQSQLLAALLVNNDLATADEFSTVKTFGRLFEDEVFARELELTEVTDGQFFQTVLFRFDQAFITEELTRIFLAQRVFEHDLTIADASTVALDLPRSDAVDTADQRTLQIDLGLTSTPSTLDQLNFLVLLTVSPTEALASDALQLFLELQKQHVVNTDDVLERRITVGRVFEDSVTAFETQTELSDGFLFQYQLPRSNEVSFSDLLERITNTRREFIDDVFLTDATALYTDLSRSHALDLADVRVLDIELQRFEELASTDLIASILEQGARQDLVLVTDTPALTPELVKAHALELQDLLERTVVFNRDLQDEVSAFETQTEISDGLRIEYNIKRFSDILTEDVLQRIFLAQRVFEHDVPAVDAASLATLLLRNDTLEHADVVTLFLDLLKLELLETTDSIAQLLQQSRQDDAAALDALQLTTELVQSHAVSLSDALQNLVIFNRAIDDAVSALETETEVSDGFLFRYQLTRSNEVTLDDVLVRVFDTQRALEHDAAITDASTLAVLLLRNHEVQTQDARQMLVDLVKFEILEPADALSQQYEKNLLLDLALLDATQLSVALQQQHTVTVSEDFDSLLVSTRLFEDTVFAAEFETELSDGILLDVQTVRSHMVLLEDVLQRVVDVQRAFDHAADILDASSLQPGLERAHSVVNSDALTLLLAAMKFDSVEQAEFIEKLFVKGEIFEETPSLDAVFLDVTLPRQHAVTVEEQLQRLLVASRTFEDDVTAFETQTEISDGFLFQYQLSRSHDVTLDDVLTRLLSVQRVFEHEVLLTSATSFIVEHFRAHDVSAGDERTLLVDKLFINDFNVQDAVQQFLDRVLNEAVTVDELVEVLNRVLRDEFDTLSIADELTLALIIGNFLLEDFVNLLDTTTLDASKGLQHEVATQQQLVLDVTTLLRDDVSVNDEFSKASFINRLLADDAQWQDTLTLTVDKGLQDSVDAQSQTILDVGVALADTILPPDIVAIILGRVLADQTLVQDLLLTSSQQQRSFEHVANNADSTSLEPGLGQQHLVAAQDAGAQLLLAVQRTFQDVVSAIDFEADVTDGISVQHYHVLRDALQILDALLLTTQSQRLVEDVIVAEDAKQLAITKRLSHALSLQDAKQLAITKRLSHAQALQDAKQLTSDKLLSHALTVLDVDQFLVAKSLQSTPSVADNEALSVTRAIADASTVLSRPVLDINKNFQDFITVLDDFQEDLTAQGRAAPQDTLGLADDRFLVINKNLQHVASTLDADQLFMHKVLIEQDVQEDLLIAAGAEDLLVGTGAEDLLSGGFLRATDVLRLAQSISSRVSDTLTLLDADQLFIDKGLSETAVTADVDAWYMIKSARQGRLTLRGDGNVLLYSTDLTSSTYWALSNAFIATVSSAATLAPDGTATAYLLTENGATSTHSLSLGQFTVVQGEYTLHSIFAKSAGTGRRLAFNGGGLAVPPIETPRFNLDTGQVFLASTSSKLLSAGMYPVGNGWYRCWVKMLPVTPATYVWSLFNSDTPGTSNSYTGTSGTGIYVWGPQINYWPNISNYTATTGSAITFNTRTANDTDVILVGNGIASARRSGDVLERTDFSINKTAQQGISTLRQDGNLTLYSTTLTSSTYYSTTNAFITAVSSAATVAPDGTATAFALTENGIAQLHGFTLASYTSVVSQVQLVSIFAKARTPGRRLAFYGMGINAVPSEAPRFNLETGQVFVTSSATKVLDAGMYPVGNGWYRCWALAQAATSGNPAWALVTSDTVGVLVDYAGTTGSGIYVWGPQVNYWPNISNYVATTGSTITFNTRTAASSDVILVGNGIASARRSGDVLERTDFSINKSARQGNNTLQQDGNLFWYSNDFTLPAWQFLETVRTTGQLAPDGTTSAIKLSEFISNDYHILSQNLITIDPGVLVAGSSYTMSCYIKSTGDSRYLTFSFSLLDAAGEAPVFNPDTGIVDLPATRNYLQDAGMYPVGNGWYRCWAHIRTGTPLTAPAFGLATSSSNNTTVQYFGTLDKGLLFWGPQINSWPTVSNYIVTDIPGITFNSRTAADSDAILVGNGVAGVRRSGDVLERLDFQITKLLRDTSNLQDNIRVSAGAFRRLSSTATLLDAVDLRSIVYYHVRALRGLGTTTGIAHLTRTNYLPYSDSFPSWNAENVHVVPATTTLSPFSTTTGSTTTQANQTLDVLALGSPLPWYALAQPEDSINIDAADLLAETSDTGHHGVYYTVPELLDNSSLEFVLNVYLRASGRTRAEVRVSGQRWAIVDLSAGTIIDSDNLSEVSLTALNNNWYRLRMRAPVRHGVAPELQQILEQFYNQPNDAYATQTLGLVDPDHYKVSIRNVNGTDTHYAGTTGLGVQVFGAQLEIDRVAMPQGNSVENYVRTAGRIRTEAGFTADESDTDLVLVGNNWGGVRRSGDALERLLLQPTKSAKQGTLQSWGNLLDYSTDPAQWGFNAGATSVTVSSSATTAPDGTATALKAMDSTTSNVVHLLESGGGGYFTLTQDRLYNLSFFIKSAGDARYMMAEMLHGVDNGVLTTDRWAVTFNPDDGTYVSTSTAATATGNRILNIDMNYMYNGWYRCSVLFRHLPGEATKTGTPKFWLKDNPLDLTRGFRTGVIDTGVYFWGPMVNTWQGPTNYLATAGTTTAVTTVTPAATDTTLAQQAGYLLNQSYVTGYAYFEYDYVGEVRHWNAGLPHFGVYPTQPPSGLFYVGGYGYESGLSSLSQHTISLTSLTGGLASAPQAGDIVIAAIAFRGGTDQNISMVTAGYTEVADLFQSTTWISQLGVYYKVLTSADTNFTVDVGISSQRVGVAVQVWRGQAATPLDVAATTAGNIGTGVPNAPSITTVTTGSVIIAIGAASADDTALQTDFTTPSGMTNLVIGNNNERAQVGMASIQQTNPGTYDPAVFGGGNSSASLAWNAVTLALRPA